MADDLSRSAAELDAIRAAFTAAPRRAPKRSLAERFFDNTEADPDTGCRISQGTPSSGGRRMTDAEGKSRFVAHVAIELAAGRAAPKGSRVRPTCGRPDCVAPAHLEIQPRLVCSAPCKRKSPAERLAARAVPRDDGCLMWTGHKDLHGYGLISVNGRQTSTHRLAWSLANGVSVPHGMQVRHICDEPLCINPAHLQIGTPEDNRRDRRERGRSARGKNSHPQMTAADRAHMLAAKEAGWTLAAIVGGWAMSVSGVQQALALAARERAATTGGSVLRPVVRKGST